MARRRASCVAALGASPLVVGGPAGPLRPLRSMDSDGGWLLYLDRYFRQEHLIRRTLVEREVIAADGRCGGGAGSTGRVVR